MNALWNSNYGTNIRILLLNNAGGEIFHALPGLELHENARRFVTATHTTSARAWAEDRGFEYLSAHNGNELHTAINAFTQPDVTYPSDSSGSIYRQSIRYRITQRILP